MAREKVLCSGYYSRIVTAREAAGIIRDGMTVAFGGNTNCGYPKKIAAELVNRRMSGEELSLTVITSSMVGPEIDEALAEAGVMRRRIPLIENRAVAKLANQGKLHYVEQQMCRMPSLLWRGDYGKIDVAVIEAAGITRDGHIIPGPSVGLLTHFAQLAESVIIEINTSIPDALDGMHDIFVPGTLRKRSPIPIMHTMHRFGEPFIRVDPKKIKYIVESDIPDFVPEGQGQVDVHHQKIAEHLLDFLEIETVNKYSGVLPPLQTGFGGLANVVVKALGDSYFNYIEFFCGGVAEPAVELLATGKAAGISTGSLQLSARVREILDRYPDYFRKHLVLRGMDVANNAESIARLGVIALNSGVEVDIYGNVNSSHISGSRVVNGIGGGANFAQNAGLSVVMLSSEGKGGDISTIVPMVAHVDICEHDVDVIVTECGVADLRGLDEIERAYRVISCACERYRPYLMDYFERARASGGHHPVLLREALSWHIRLMETGSMLP